MIDAAWTIEENVALFALVICSAFKGVVMPIALDIVMFPEPAAIFKLWDSAESIAPERIRSPPFVVRVGLAVNVILVPICNWPLVVIFAPKETAPAPDWVKLELEEMGLATFKVPELLITMVPPAVVDKMPLRLTAATLARSMLPVVVTLLKFVVPVAERMVKAPELLLADSVKVEALWTVKLDKGVILPTNCIETAPGIRAVPAERDKLFAPLTARVKVIGADAPVVAHTLEAVSVKGWAIEMPVFVVIFAPLDRFPAPFWVKEPALVTTVVLAKVRRPELVRVTDPELVVIFPSKVI